MWLSAPLSLADDATIPSEIIGYTRLAWTLVKNQGCLSFQSLFQYDMFRDGGRPTGWLVSRLIPKGE